MQLKLTQIEGEINAKETVKIRKVTRFTQRNRIFQTTGANLF